jgi:hypothetical protein
MPIEVVFYIELYFLVGALGSIVWGMFDPEHVNMPLWALCLIHLFWVITYPFVLLSFLFYGGANLGRTLSLRLGRFFSSKIGRNRV